MKLSSVLLLLSVASSLANPVAPPPDLMYCLRSNSLNVEDSQDQTWSASTTPFNKRIQYTPAAIVYPKQTSDVSQAIQCAVKSGIHVSALSGGHSYSASGYGSRNGSLVIMFRDMNSITVQSGGTASIQPGSRLGDVALELKNHGRALAHGVCPYVGVGGHAGFGGWGPASRNWGLLIDQVIGAEVVLANGTVVQTGPSSGNRDLFWGIRGASAAFGIVTQYTFQTHEAPVTVVRFSYNYGITSATQFAKVLQAYQSWAFTAPRTMGITANIWQQGRDIEFTGYCMCNQSDFDSITKSFLSSAGAPNTTYVQEREWIPALVELNGGGDLSTKNAAEAHNTFFAKSLVVPMADPVSTEALQSLANYFLSNPRSDLNWFIQFELWGGRDSAITAVSPGATAYPHREQLLTIQFYASSADGQPPFPEDGLPFAEGLVESITDKMPRTDFGAYANYIDPTLHGWQHKYYSGNYARLAEVQKDLDPQGVFVKAQNIGAPDPGANNAFHARKTVSVTFSETGPTKDGEAMYVSGSLPQLGSSYPELAIRMDPSKDSAWVILVDVADGTSFQYKYIRKDRDGTIVWQSDEKSYTPQ